MTDPFCRNISMRQGSKAARLIGTCYSKNLNQINADPLSSISQSQLQHSKRLFFKSGHLNISRSNINKRGQQYLTDIFTTLVDFKWRYYLIFFALGFLSSWLLFALTYYFISYFHGDLELENLQNKDYSACLIGITSFSTALSFSIETQQTIGKYEY